MNGKNWREIDKNIKDANPQVDSFELSDSWKNRPRRTEGIANKTNGLYRRSELQPVPMKNLYQLIIDKQQKPTVDRQPESNSTNAQSQKTLIPIAQPISVGDADDGNSLNFTQFLGGKDIDLKAVTSTPFPLRQIDVNKSPIRINDVQRRAADSPKKQFLLAPTRIPIITPRSSRIPNDSERCGSYKHRSVINKMSSPVVSSTVGSCEDDCEIQPNPVESPEEEEPACSLSVQNVKSSRTENTVHCVPLDEVQQEQEACIKPSDEEIFRRPQMVRLPSQKQNKLEGDCVRVADQSDLSTQSTRSQRIKKSKQKVDSLLESYIKIGESINKTNVVPSESSSSRRRLLYKKGDSCNEDELLKAMEPVDQQCSGSNQLLANENEVYAMKQMASVQSNEVDGVDIEAAGAAGIVQNIDFEIGPPKTSSDVRSMAVLQTEMPVTELINNIDLTDCDDSDPEAQEQIPSSNKATELLDNVQSQQAGDKEKDRSNNAKSIGQRNPMSEKHSSKQVLEEILVDWTDTSKKQNYNEDDCSGTEQVILRNGKKQPPSRVRQVRSENQKTQEVNIPSSKTARRQAHPNTERVHEEDASEEDEFLTSNRSDRVLTNNRNYQNAVTKTITIEETGASKNSEAGPVEHESIVGEPLRKNTKNPQEKNEENQIPPRKQGRPRKRRTDKVEEIEGNKIPPRKPGRPQKQLTDDAIEVEENQIQPPIQDCPPKQTIDSEADKVEDIEVNKSPPRKKGGPRKRRHESENDGNEVKWSTRSHVKAKQKRLNVEEGATGTNDSDEPAIEINDGDNAVQLQVDEDNVEENLMQPPRQGRPSKRRVESETVSNELENAEENQIQPCKPSRTQKRRLESECDGNEVESSAKPKANVKKKRPNVEEGVTETNGGDETGQQHTDNNANKVQNRKRKQQLTAEGKSQTNVSNQPNEKDDNQSSSSNVSVSKKPKKLGKWDRKTKAPSYNALKPREISTGTRHSTRERRKPQSNLLIFVPVKDNTTNLTHFHTSTGNAASKRMTAASSSTQGNAASKRMTAASSSNAVSKRVTKALRSTQGNAAPENSIERESVYSMLINGTNDSEPPLITRLRGIEITQGFHKTVKNNLVIHHIPGETGPSYGYFTLEPGMEKRSCRISWNLHLHVVLGPVIITTEQNSETMATGSFASLHSGTKYSLRNDGENASLIFFSQHWPDNSENVN